AQISVGSMLLRWLSLWSLGLAGGFAVWRVFYLRATDKEASAQKIGALNRTALARALVVGRVVAPITAVGALAALTTPYLNFEPVLKWGLFAALIALTASLIIGIDRQWSAIAAMVLTASALILWAVADGAPGLPMVIRAAHLIAFSLWLGGALWNIWVAMPAARDHANTDAVIAGAHQLDRFRWVVRFALPTIILTGLYMAAGYRFFDLQWWTSFPGFLIPSKVLAILALVVVFITCPLFRHCSPVQGVCDLEDLEEDSVSGQ
ncbi:MAG TPA: hypothetical protein VK030_01540, partial [Actinomycetales bacterium]|nr:hypothetical protein [Actinomycetales bacterium]